MNMQLSCSLKLKHHAPSIRGLPRGCRGDHCPQPLADPLAQRLRQASQRPRLGLSGPTLGPLIAHMGIGPRSGLSRPMMGTRLGPAWAHDEPKVGP
jgi:hypothetical protein